MRKNTTKFKYMLTMCTEVHNVGTENTLNFFRMKNGEGSLLVRMDPMTTQTMALGAVISYLDTIQIICTCARLTHVVSLCASLLGKGNTLAIKNIKDTMHNVYLVDAHQ